MVHSQISNYLQLCRLNKPVGIFLLLWPTLWALFDAAKGLPNLKILAIFGAGVILMRSAGCVINDYADRNFDDKVNRTKHRPLSQKTILPSHAIQLFIALCLIAFNLVLQLNSLTISLSFIALLLAAIYPFIKRFSHLPQLVLGAAFSWSIPMSYGAILNDIPPQTWILFAANLCWTVAYDTQYAMIDKDDDLKIGIKSTAILFGKFDCHAIAILQFLTLTLLSWFGLHNDYSTIFYFGIALAFLHFAWQTKLISGREKTKCFQAFKSNNQVGLIITLALLAAQLYSGLQ